MNFLFIVAASLLFAGALLQYGLIRLLLPKRLSTATSIIIASAATLIINAIPLLYMGTEPILDQLPWWHRHLVIFPYTIFMVTSISCGFICLVVFFTRSTVAKPFPHFDTDKRDFLRNTARVLTAASLGTLTYGSYCENGLPQISRIALPYSRLHPDLCGLRIVQITDIHAGPFISFESIAATVSMVNALKPDLILLTGDYINNNPAYVDGCLLLLDGLRAPCGVFGVYGNHDYYTGIRVVRDAFAKTHITMLNDSTSTPKGLEGLLNIIGVNDPVSGIATDAEFRDPARISRLVAPGQLNLLLSHRPGIFKICKDWKVDLTLAGHTHGGQVIVPMVGTRGLSLAGLFFTYTHGLYHAESDPEIRMYVNRGIGTIGAPVRLFCDPEIAEITLTRG
ncbi:MAG: hypothetical protein DRH50_07455 [Deltaproteobacteria bacterium]|nr:MAG: hypothetical protein DRH50_07455 [Deltaproteobacteria bacterium]